MTTIRILQAIAGLATADFPSGFSFSPGMVVSIPAAVATAWINASIATATVTPTVGVTVFLR
jgi:hypothetical protein